MATRKSSIGTLAPPLPPPITPTGPALPPPSSDLPEVGLGALPPPPEIAEIPRRYVRSGLKIFVFALVVTLVGVTLWWPVLQYAATHGQQQSVTTPSQQTTPKRTR